MEGHLYCQSRSVSSFLEREILEIYELWFDLNKFDVPIPFPTFYSEYSWEHEYGFINSSSRYYNTSDLTAVLSFLCARKVIEVISLIISVGYFFGLSLNFNF